MSQRDERYLRAIVEPIRVCAKYRPKFGQGANSGGLTLKQFQALYGGDQFYSWLGLDNPLMYAAHKAAGGMTSIYRQIGIGCERLFRTILMDQFRLSEQDVSWSYNVPGQNGKKRKLSLDGRVPLDRIAELAARNRFREWMRECSGKLSVDEKISDVLTGTVFEVRQGYKSKDSKRQNADIGNAASAYTKAYLPCAVVLSNQIDGDILSRYRAEKWCVLTAGRIGSNDPTQFTYDFLRDVIGYDLAGFFQRNSAALRSEIDQVLRALLAPEES